MRFIEGMLIGGLLAVGATYACVEMMPKNETKKMMKKGKQFARKMGLV